MILFQPTGPDDFRLSLEPIFDGLPGDLLDQGYGGFLFGAFNTSASLCP